MISFNSYTGSVPARLDLDQAHVKAAGYPVKLGQRRGWVWGFEGLSKAMDSSFPGSWGTLNPKPVQVRAQGDTIPFHEVDFADCLEHQVEKGVPTKNDTQTLNPASAEP